MAALLALWMATSAATALVLLPALLVVIRPRFLGGPSLPHAA
jgi:predicted RND superfamily exporter protein